MAKPPPVVQSADEFHLESTLANLSDPQCVANPGKKYLAQLGPTLLLVPHLFSTVKNQACRPLASSFSPRPAQTRSKVEDKHAKNITNTFYLAFRHGRFFFIALSDARVVSYVLEPSLRVAYVLSVCLLWPTLRCVLLLLSYCVTKRASFFTRGRPLCIGLVYIHGL